MNTPHLLKTFPDGRTLMDFDPADEYPDSEDVGSAYQVKRRLKGITPEGAERKSEKRLMMQRERVGYKTFVPCVGCTWCIIIRATEHGTVKNTYYACQRMKMRVDRYGTCVDASEGNGPMVIEKNLTMEEIAARKNELVN